MSKPRDAVATRLANLVHDLASLTLPDAVASQCRIHVMDLVGVAIAGSRDRIGATMRGYAAHLGRGQSTALSVRYPLSAPDAAHVNGALAHAIEYDDAGFGGHASACVLPAVLAVAEPSRRSGAQVLAAYAVGMEVFGLLADLSAARETTPDEDSRAAFHPTGILGVLAATAAVGVVLGLDPGEATHSLAIAASQGTGLAANFGTMVKPLHAAAAASGGVRAALLAASGLKGNPEAFEDPQGLGRAYFGSVSWDVDDYVPWRLQTRPPRLKPWACCGAAHRAVHNALQLRRGHALEAASIARVQVTADPGLLTVLGRDWPSDEYRARFSLSFNVAAALATGELAPAHHLLPLREAPVIRGLWERTRVQPVHDAPHRRWTRVEVQLHDGTVLVSEDDVVPGSAQHPLSPEQRTAKWRECLDGSMSEQDATKLRNAIEELDGRSTAFWDVWTQLGQLDWKPR